MSSAEPDDIVVHAASPVPPAIAFGLAMTLGVSALFLRIPMSFLHLTRVFDVLRFLGFVLVVLAAIPRRVHVGPEAIRIRWLAGTRLVRYDDVTRAAPLGADLVIVLRGGGGIRLHPPIFGRRKRIVSEALERIWMTISAGAESGTRSAERALLGREGRTPRAWALALRELVPHGAQYRHGMDHGRLWSIVENPAVDTELRAAAAIALSATFDDDARSRLRAVVRKTIDPQLRQALAQIAEAYDESALESALGALVTASPS